MLARHLRHLSAGHQTLGDDPRFLSLRAHPTPRRSFKPFKSADASNRRDAQMDVFFAVRFHSKPPFKSDKASHVQLDPDTRGSNERLRFRDTKDLRFGMGLGVLRIADPQRRDRLLLLNAFAIVLLTLLGPAGESLGMDRHLKVNTAKRRTHSLFR
ncbi:hypothetical protein Nham_3971 [Nitrobacter hamburgensis X14]|uniref:Uncharacterized protein n=1 Tax=Nitrobacter hamburgensis (strain DSM 10229 / NCIMB 13809 / X14) TaxID=323097 RepID=Q1QGK1_NITHX|nr:hypothetical protein Nham_3971 [Nitrobacter hamburgensis X14]